LLVLEQSRVEVAVQLNELAYLKYEASKSSSSTAETIVLKQRNVAIAFSLMEKIIKLISNAAENEGM
jgi:transposase-like protein